MEVRVRHLVDAEAVHFTEIDFHDAEALIDFVKRSSGMCFHDMDNEPFHSYSLVCGPGGAYMELVMGEEPE